MTATRHHSTRPPGADTTTRISASCTPPPPPVVSIASWWWPADRLHRGGPAEILGVWKTLHGYDVQLMSRREPFIETSSGAGKAFTELLVMITGWYAQLESDLISERTKAALAKRREAGHTLGRPKGSKDTRKRKRRTARRNTTFIQGDQY